MTDATGDVLLERVLDLVKNHPGVSIPTAQAEMKRPPLEVEACFDRLKRAGRICQPLPGQWHAGHTFVPIVLKEMPPPPAAEQAPKRRGLPPMGPTKRCRACGVEKKHFLYPKWSRVCKACKADQHRAWQRSMRGKPTPKAERGIHRRHVAQRASA